MHSAAFCILHHIRLVSGVLNISGRNRYAGGVSDGLSGTDFAKETGLSVFSFSGCKMPFPFSSIAGLLYRVLVKYTPLMCTVRFCRFGKNVGANFARESGWSVGPSSGCKVSLPSLEDIFAIICFSMLRSVRPVRKNMGTGLCKGKPDYPIFFSLGTKCRSLFKNKFIYLCFSISRSVRPIRKIRERTLQRQTGLSVFPFSGTKCRSLSQRQIRLLRSVFQRYVRSDRSEKIWERDFTKDIGLSVLLSLGI